MKDLNYFLLELSFNDNRDDSSFINDLKNSIAGCKFTIKDLLEYCPNKDDVLELLDGHYESILQLFYYKRVMKDLNKMESIFTGLSDSLKRFALISMPHILPDALFFRHFSLLLSEDFSAVERHLRLFSEDYNLNQQLYSFDTINKLFKHKNDFLDIYVCIYNQAPSNFNQIKFDKLDEGVLLYFLNTLHISVFEPFYFHLYIDFKNSKITEDDLKKYVNVFLKSIQDESRLESVREDRDAFVFRATMFDILSTFYSHDEVVNILGEQQ